MEKAKILIVEDEAIIAMEIESQLQGLGYEVISIVDTGEKAIKKAGEDNPDLILMDIRIKGEMDGIQTAAIIREQFDIPVVFSTAYLDEERIELANAIKYLDAVVPQNTYSPIENLKTIKPNILIESTSHSKDSIKHIQKYMDSINGEVIVVPYYNGQSSTKIKSMIKKNY